MSRSDLDQIQAQLKIAIQNHQILVSRLKNDPQNASIKKQLHEVQTQIRTLSEKQKSVVQLLKELVIKKNENEKVPPKKPTEENVFGKTAPNNNNDKGELLKVQKSINKSPAKSSRPKASQPISTKPHGQQQTTVSKPLQPILPKPAPQQQVSSAAHAASNSNKSPIKVPQLPSHHRPSILGRQSLRSHHPNSPVKRENSLSLSNTVSSLKRSVLEGRNKDLHPAEREKHEYMACLDLITPDLLKDLQSRRSERKRRSTANPQFAYGNYELERRRPVNYLVNMTPRPKKPPPAPKPAQPPAQPRKRGRPPKKRGPWAYQKEAQAKASPSNSQEQQAPSAPSSPSPSVASSVPSRPSTPSSRPSTPSTKGRATPSASSRPSTPVSKRSAASPTESNIACKRSLLDSEKSNLESKQGTMDETGDDNDDENSTKSEAASADIHEHYCAVCRRSGELMMCDLCSKVYHLNCVEPPLKEVPKGVWACHKCAKEVSEDGAWSGNLAMVQSYMQQRSSKEQEKKKLEKKHEEMQGERIRLENKAKALKQTLSKHMQERADLTESRQNYQTQVSQIKELVKVLQDS